MKKQKRCIQKRSFILFEVLLSLTLVTLCFLPLLSPQLWIYRQEKQRLEMMRQAFASKKAVCKLKEQLFQHEISWKELSENTQGRVAVNFSGQDYLFHYDFKKLKRRPKKGPEKLLLVQLTLNLPSKTKDNLFSYTLCVERELT